VENPNGKKREDSGTGSPLEVSTAESVCINQGMRAGLGGDGMDWACSTSPGRTKVSLFRSSIARSFVPRGAFAFTLRCLSALATLGRITIRVGGPSSSLLDSPSFAVEDDVSSLLTSPPSVVGSGVSSSISIASAIEHSGEEDAPG